MKMPHIRSILAAMVAVAALTLAHTALATSTFSLERSGGNFIVRRSGNGTCKAVIRLSPIRENPD